MKKRGIIIVALSSFTRDPCASHPIGRDDAGNDGRERRTHRGHHLRAPAGRLMLPGWSVVGLAHASTDHHRASGGRRKHHLRR